MLLFPPNVLWLWLSFLAKCKEKITHPNAHFIDGIRPLAGMMFPLAEKAIAEQDFKDVAYFEPFYLKEFVAGTPKKLI